MNRIKKTTLTPVLTVLMFIGLLSAIGLKINELNYNIIKQEETLIKQEETLIKLSKYAPPLFGGRHRYLRKHFISEQIANATDDYILLVGDSIVEGLFLPKIKNIPTLIGGIGGGGISDASELLDNIEPDKKLNAIVILIGINDTIIVQPTPTKDWEKQLNHTIEKAIQLVGKDNVYVSTIIPVERNKPLGDAYFDQNLILALNTIIKEKTSENDINLIDHYKVFTEQDENKIEFTTDGVHLNSFGYRLLKEQINRIVN